MGESQKKDTETDLLRERVTYEFVRREFKLGGLATFFVLFKSCISLGMFSYPYAFSKAGVIYGMILTIIFCHLSTYGMYSCVKSAKLIEDFKQGKTKFPTYQSKML